MMTPVLERQGNLRDVAALSWPLIIGTLSYSVMDVTDTLFVGWIGTTELAAVGLGSTVVMLFNGFFMGFFEATKILVAQAIGGNNRLLAQRAGWQSAWLAIPCGLIVVFLSLFDDQILGAFGAPSEVQELAEDFFQIRVLASPFWFAQLAIGAYFQGTGDTRTPMRINIVDCVLNVVFCYLFVFGFGPIPAMGVQGAALATVFAVSLTLIALVWLFIKRNGFLFEMNREITGKLINVGWPIGVRFFLGIGAWSVLTAFVARMGEVALAANQIATKFMSVGTLPGYGIGEAAAILTGQFVGAGDSYKVNKTFWSAIRFTIMVMGGIGFLLFIAPKFWVSLFQDNPEVIALGATLVMIVVFTQLFDALQMVAAGALNGTGDTKFTMYVMVLSTWFITVPLAYLLGDFFELGPFGVWLAILFEVIWLFGWMVWRFKSNRWKKFKISMSG